ncbi:pirin domain-containing protein [Dichomitus squalens LYAD-421 SS1]|uniref:Pirin domain-containing protein n=1 Tax=Dichomitus squalens TaxID=114155 RepID=A0A4Q9M6T5_9APHY|nr:pirin domain-containing protein [Dichomitus squalens LYAD-421 SS1]EJF64307.1 pirin domain-containing protein [Dichomitus squalens LYAD-421 SS1]TBU22710.1 pirin domain-containing protein [Dichomitus squalens]
MKLVPRYSTERGNADHGWLKTFHTFSFASYHNPSHDSFGSLRVINEDRVEPKTGFGTHAHREFEIFSYIVNGELEHRDSMGNIEIMKRGDLQMTSAGTGIRHSEHAHGDKQVHFLQIWSLPSTRGLAPQYFTRHFNDDEKKDRWAHVVAPVGAEGVEEKREASGPAPVHSPLNLFATLLSPAAKVSHAFSSASTSRKGYLHVVQTSGYNPKLSTGAHVRVLGAEGGPLDLKEGDGAYVMAASGDELTIENVGDRVAEVLLFDME